MRSQVLRYGAVIGLALHCQQASAAAMSCVTPIIQVGTSGWGSVTLSTNFSSAALTCSLSGTINTVTASTCQAWYGTFLSAQATGRPVRLFYDTAETYNTTLQLNVCTGANFGSWVWRVPYYVMVE
jgi:hypothetical protein